VAVTPPKPERVVADLFDVSELEVAARLKLNDAGMALAAGTRAVTANDLVWVARAVAVGPGDLELSSTVGGDHPGCARARLVRHERRRISRKPREKLAIAGALCHIPRPLANPSESVQCKPLEVQVGDKGIERAIKHLKRKMAGEGILRELKRRRHYMKPSVKRRKKMSEAARRRRKRLKTDDLPRTMA